MTVRANRQKSTPAARLAPSRVLRIYGMRRSGNHAIVNWLQRNTPDGNSVFLNNCHPRRDPIRSHKSLEVFVDGNRRKFEDADDLQSRMNTAGEDPLVMVSYEDAMPPADDAALDPLFKAPMGETVVLIYRAFLNWSASLLQKLLGNVAYGPLARARIMAASCITYGHALDRVAERETRGFVAICYDLWHASEDYRAGILGALGFPVRDNTRGAVQRYGGGSSFQGKAATVDALQTDRRSEQMADHPEYKTLLWTVAHDARFMERLAGHFPNDARRLLALAETATLNATLPSEVPAT